MNRRELLKGLLVAPLATVLEPPPLQPETVDSASTVVNLVCPPGCPPVPESAMLLPVAAVGLAKQGRYYRVKLIALENGQQLAAIEWLHDPGG